MSLRSGGRQLSDRGDDMHATDSASCAKYDCERRRAQRSARSLLDQTGHFFAVFRAFAHAKADSTAYETPLEHGDYYGSLVQETLGSTGCHLKSGNAVGDRGQTRNGESRLYENPNTSIRRGLAGQWEGCPLLPRSGGSHLNGPRHNHGCVRGLRPGSGQNEATPAVRVLV